ncbi:hypothetical protein NKJ73_19805 [Mesorhizobium sp. M0074]|uniref:hypothetical protein n=1 Tax=Mesorhizobium sp. M0074 TaxID=2956869 RepID=UPI003335B5F1
MPTPINVLRTANHRTSMTNITSTVALIDGQRLTLIINDAFTTIRNQVGGAGRFHLLDNVDKVCVSGDVLDFINVGGFWRQISPSRKLRASAAVDPASIALGACTTPATIAVTGAVLGDFVRASFSQAQAGVSLHAYVSAADTVEYFFRDDVGAKPARSRQRPLRVEVTKP